MSENSIKGIIDRLKSEGQLVRNTGTNSIKSVKETISLSQERMGDIFSAISEQMQLQTDILSSLLKEQKKIYDLEVESLKDAARKDRLATRSKSRTTTGSTGETAGGTSILANGTGGFLGGVAQEFLGALGAIGVVSAFGTLFRRIFTGLTSLLTLSNLRRIMGRGFLVMISGPLGEAVNNIIQSGLDVFDPEFLDGYRNSIRTGITDAINWGAIGLLLGRKWAAIFALGGIVSSVFDNLVESSENEIIAGLRNEWGSETIADIAGIIASAFGYLTLRRALNYSLFGRSDDTDADGNRRRIMRPELRSVFRTSFRAGLGLTGMMMFFGDSLSSQISQYSESEEMGAAIEDVVSLALLGGTVLGAKGALLGAIAGLAIAGFRGMKNWIEERRDEFVSGVISDAEEILERARRSLEEGNAASAIEEVSDAMARIISETNRLDDLLGQNARENADRYREQISALAAFLDEALDSADISPEDYEYSEIARAADLLYESSERTVEDYERYIERMMEARRIFGLGDPEDIIESMDITNVPDVLVSPEGMDQIQQILLRVAERVFDDLDFALPDNSNRWFWQRGFYPEVVDMSTPPVSSYAERSDSERLGESGSGVSVVAPVSGPSYTDSRQIVTNNIYNSIYDPTRVLDPAFVGAQ